MDFERGLVLAAVVGSLLLIGFVLRKLLERFLGPHRALLRVPLTPISELVEGRRCRVVGVARRNPEHPPLTARFTGRPALIYEGELRQEDRTSDTPIDYRFRAGESLAVASFCVEDDTGTVVVHPPRLATRRDYALWQRQSMEMVPMDKVEALLANYGHGMKPADLEEGFPWGWSVLPTGYRVNEAVLQEGQRVVVVGVARAESRPDASSVAEGYREAPRRLGLGGDMSCPLFVTNVDRLVARLGPER